MFNLHTDNESFLRVAENRWSGNDVLSGLDEASKQRINRFTPCVYGLTYPNCLSYNMSTEYQYSRHSYCVLSPRNFSLRCWFTRRPKHLTERGRESNGGLRMVTDVATLVWPRGLQLDCTCKKPSNYGFIGLQRRNIARYHTPAPSLFSHLLLGEKFYHISKGCSASPFPSLPHIDQIRPLLQNGC